MFAIVQTVVAPTTDEGNNWINLVFGPLSLGNPTQTLQLGNYSLQGTSPAINSVRLLQEAAGFLAAPDHDFFGNPRKTLGTGAVDRGAVEVR